MPRNDATKLNEAPSSLPVLIGNTLTTNANILTQESESELLNRIADDIAVTSLQLKQLENLIIEQEARNTEKSESVQTNFVVRGEPDSFSTIANQHEEIASVIYPNILELLDQPVNGKSANTKQQELNENKILDIKTSSVKRKRQRKVYTTVIDRCASLRSRKVENSTESPTHTLVVPAIITPASVELKHKEEEVEETSTETDYLNPEFWNKIEQLEYEEPKTTKRRRHIFGLRKRVAPSASPLHKQIQSQNLTVGNPELSPSTAAAIAAAQLEFDNISTPSPIKKKRTRNMSLYDRRYQTTDDRRGVGNGYMSSSTRNSSAGSVGASAHSDVDGSETQNQYFITAPNSSNSSTSGPTVATTSSVCLNGSVALNHTPSMGTLCNIGNTCYLNSVVYTLRFAPHFLHNLHHLLHDLNIIQQTILRQRNAKSASLGRGISAAHLENARSWSSKDLASLEQYNNSVSSCGKSTHQSLTEKLHDLYQSLNRNEVTDSTEPHHADTLLHAIQDVNATFEGNQQQDAHEFLMCVLNSLRETNQMLIKAVAECPDVIVNGYIANPDELDSGYQQDNNSSNSNNANLLASGNASNSGGNGSSTTTSLTSKASFFSRKSKRKDETKYSKNSRIQSPLKDGKESATLQIQQQQPTSNSLFYLNTVDLSGTQSAAANNSSTSSSGASTVCTKSASDDETSAAINLLKDKSRIEEKIRELNLDFFTEDFEGVVVLTTKCLSCETITKSKQGLLDISVPVPISGYETSDYIDKPSAYIQNSCITREYFCGENKYSCDQCTGYTEAIRSVSYEVLPRLLVIQLNRFSGGMEKINTYVPTTFTLPCFCAKCCELSDANKLHVYKLYSVITHVGATLSVGHYIAYTCCLDWANEYINCPKDRRNMNAQQQQQQQTINADAAVTTNSNTVSAALASSGTSLMKKMKFGRSKASSSGDMSKNVKQLNGISSKTITNGISKLCMNTTCHGLNCCAMRFCKGTQHQQQSQQASNSASSSDFSEESIQNGTNCNLNYSSSNNINNANNNSNSSNNNNNNNGGSNSSYHSSGYGSTGRGNKFNYLHTNAEPIWYMCDDDKIKAMSQREFEELLSPTRKITITPYLLFYARFDLQTTATTSVTAAATLSTTVTQGTGKQITTLTSSQNATNTSNTWSSENIQSGSLHKI